MTDSDDHHHSLFAEGVKFTVLCLGGVAVATLTAAAAMTGIWLLIQLGKVLA